MTLIEHKHEESVGGSTAQLRPPRQVIMLNRSSGRCEVNKRSNGTWLPVDRQLEISGNQISHRDTVGVRDGRFGLNDVHARLEGRSGRRLDALRRGCL